MSILLNDTKSAATKNGIKFDCAKECPCGVPVIPVPDQWLEVMVTGGFKVWHIIFIIIAFVVTIVVVYCCFHRCRIPRTKQEIEADLMRTNMTNKFRDYLQEFPNEPTTFIEALKKVQDLEEKSSEQDDPSARKRMGWLKLKGKDRQDKNEPPPPPPPQPLTKDGPQNGTGQEATTVAPKCIEDGLGQEVPTDGTVEDKTSAPETDKKTSDKSDRRQAIVAEQSEKSSTLKVDNKLPGLNLLKPIASASIDKTTRAKVADSEAVAGVNLDKSRHVEAAHEKKAKVNEAKLVKSKGEKVELKAQKFNDDKLSLQADASGSTSSTKPAKVRRQRDKPNLSRTKAAHVGFRTESVENHNQLNLPAATTGRHHTQHHNHHSQSALQHPDQAVQDEQVTPQPPPPPSSQTQPPTSKERRRGKSRSRSPPAAARKAKTKEANKSTVIKIES